jgi:hypothetical protein
VRLAVQRLHEVVVAVMAQSRRQIPLPLPHAEVGRAQGPVCAVVDQKHSRVRLRVPEATQVRSSPRPLPPPHSAVGQLEAAVGWPSLMRFPHLLCSGMYCRQ